MSGEGRMLTHQQAKAFYDRLGSKQDLQAFYELPATNKQIAHAAFEEAQSVFECGCGTGAFAERLLSRHLPPQARYLAVDSSSTMVRLARARLARFVSNYVLDLLSCSDLAQLLAEAHRLLVAEGRLCLVSLTRGSTPLSRLVTWSWTRVHALEPRLVGGCRPVELRDCMSRTGFHIDYARVITRFEVPSEVVVASKQSSEDEGS
jgi:ubiquinone/menaquinone biosynthesis C-methylase UbiE